MNPSLNIFCLILVAFQVTHLNSQAIHQCVWATRKMAKAGDGSTEDSCMGCDPALPFAAPDCQRLIDRLYYRCAGICLPEGYYFDPQSELSGCWDDNKPQVKIKVERCGGNSAPSLHSKLSMGIVIMLIIAVTYLAI